MKLHTRIIIAGSVKCGPYRIVRAAVSKYPSTTDSIVVEFQHGTDTLGNERWHVDAQNGYETDEMTHEALLDAVGQLDAANINRERRATENLSETEQSA